MLQILEEINVAYLCILGVLFSVLAAGIVFCTYKEQDHMPTVSSRYLDRSLSIDERVADLLSQMTLEEKIGQMALVEKNSIEEVSDISMYGIGAVLSGAGGKPEPNTAEAWSDMVEVMKEESRRTRLSIPLLYGVDAIHGHGNVPGATIFPHFIGLGATGDSELVEDIAHATRKELLATGINWSYSPTLDMPEDIRWGRVYETFSDDPALTAKLGAAYIRGLQRTGEVDAVLATAKHYVGTGGMEFGTSFNENFLIDQGTTPNNESVLRDVYLPPFKEAIDAGALSVMVGLNGWGETKMSAEKYLITDVLKDELGLKGFVVSDWYGVYEISGNNFNDAVTAINAGVDMVMLPFDYRRFVQNVSLAVDQRLISEERIDDAVRRILYAKFSMGLFDDHGAAGGIGTVDHRVLARDAVAKSMALLKNDSNILPLATSTKRIKVAGSAAHNIGKQSGAWTVEWQGIDGNWLPGATSILDGIRAVADDSIEIEFEENGRFPDSTARADIGIAIVGEKPYAEGWGDVTEPRLSEVDLATIERLKEVSEKVVVILVTGRPLLITEYIGDWDALVVAWLPGSEGAGVADVLFGTKPFTGTLPLSWPAHVEQLPITHDGKTADGTPVLFERYFKVE